MSRRSKVSCGGFEAVQPLERRVLMSVTLVDGTLTVRGTDANDTNFVDAAAPVDGRARLTTLDGSQELQFDRDAVRRIVMEGLGGDDILVVDAELSIPATYRGGAGDDILVGGGGPDEFFGGSGNDTVQYNGGKENVFISLDGVANDGPRRDGNVHTDVENANGGDGDDVIVGSAGNNALEGRGGNDTIRGLGGDDVIFGGEGDDVIIDTSGRNQIDGGGGTDTINGVRDPFDAAVYQAESARLSGAVVGKTGTGYTGAGYADYVNRSGDFVEWTAYGPGIGTTQKLTFRYANGGSTDRPLELKVNGQVFRSRLSFRPTGGWNKWSEVTVDAPLGSFGTVRLTAVGSSGPNIDALLVRAIDLTPRTFQAETFAMSGAGVRQTYPGYTGTGFVDFFQKSGAWVELTFQNADAGVYDISVRYANGSGAWRNLDFSINGTAVPFGMSFPSIGGWSDWQTTGYMPRLPAGTVKLRFQTNGTEGPNLDSITITRIE